jgi:hypothetical protein
MNDREFIRGFEGVHNRRFLGFAALALLAFVVVMSGVIAGFRGNHVRRSADAISLVQPAQPRIYAPLPAK